MERRRFIGTLQIMSALLTVGQVLPTQHSVERYLGEGAFAQVYRVKHRVFGRQAMKVFKVPIRPEQDISALLSEAVILKRFQHSNIVRVYDAGTLQLGGDDYCYLTMEYAGGGTLHDLWRSYGLNRMRAVLAVDLVRQAAAGLALAHSVSPPIIHRDIKPTNILVAIAPEGYQAKVSDFGLARHVNPLTLMATAAGTPIFKAPEIFAVAKSDSPAADVWSLGVTLYFLLTDQMPFELPKDYQPTPRHFEKPPIPPSRINVDVDEKLDKIVLRSLSLHPAWRQSNAGELNDELQQWHPAPKSALKAEEMPLSSTKSLRNILHPPVTKDRQQAEALVKKAMNLAREGKLAEASDALEEAIVANPDLRSSYEGRVRLWRMGIAM